MRKQIIRLTENDLHNMISECVHTIIEGEEYDPYMNGDASWIDGSYDIPYGFHVEIDSSMGTVSIEDSEGNDENSYFLQGDEADDIIKQIAQYWSENDCSQDEAVNTVISGLI